MRILSFSTKSIGSTACSARSTSATPARLFERPPHVDLVAQRRHPQLDAPRPRHREPRIEGSSPASAAEMRVVIGRRRLDGSFGRRWRLLLLLPGRDHRPPRERLVGIHCGKAPCEHRLLPRPGHRQHLESAARPRPRHLCTTTGPAMGGTGARCANLGGRGKRSNQFDFIRVVCPSTLGARSHLDRTLDRVSCWCRLSAGAV